MSRDDQAGLSEAEREALWLDFSRNTPESFWDVAVWGKQGWFTGILDVADRKRIVMDVLARIVAERTRAAVERAESRPCRHDEAEARMSALIEASSLGSPEAKAARESVPPEIGRLLVRCAGLMRERDEAERAVARVGALIEEWEQRGVPTFPLVADGRGHPVIARLRAALGGDGSGEGADGDLRAATSQEAREAEEDAIAPEAGAEGAREGNEG